jgi:VanZ family protein
MTLRGTVLVIARVCFVIALVGVAWASLEPIDQVPGPTNLSDKLLHLVAYAALGITAALAQRRLRIILTIVVLTLFGFLIEVLQGRTGYRSFDLHDLLADAVGAAFGVLLVATILGFTQRERAES